MSEESNTVLLEDGSQYAVAKTLEHNGEKYMLLTSMVNPKQICIRKIKKEANSEYVCRLEENEFDTILNLFIDGSNIV